MAHARHAADSGAVLVEPSSEPGEVVVKGIGAVFGGELASPYFLVPSRRFNERFGRRGFGAGTGDPELLAPERLELALSLQHVQLAMISDEARDIRRVQPMLERLAQGGTALCLIAEGFAPAVVELLVQHHHQTEIGCAGIEVSADTMRAIYRLGAQRRRHTGCFGKDEVDLGQLVDVVEFRAGKLMLFNRSTSAIPGFDKAALIRVGRGSRTEALRAAHELRRTLLESSH